MIRRKKYFFREKLVILLKSASTLKETFLITGMSLFKSIFIFFAVIFYTIHLPCFAKSNDSTEYDLFINDIINLSEDLKDDAINLYCLKKSYPDIREIVTDNDKKWLAVSENDQVIYVLYYDKNLAKTGLESDIKTSMEQIYPLESSGSNLKRPDTPEGFAPGRNRSYKLFKILYGKDKNAVKKQIEYVPFMGKSLALSKNAAESLKRITPKLHDLTYQKHELKKYLKPEGGFYWRNIAGENVPSAHSFGIAFDIGVNHSPYWRWSKKMPHPLQKTYPEEIVRLMEDAGFIWGGKWHEYDLMHYEYRPELICKAKIIEKMNK